MKRSLLMLALVSLVFGCGGGGAKNSTNETAQGAARLWLNAATTGNEAKVRELTVDSYEETALKVVKILREDQFTDENLLWSAGGVSGGMTEWSAAAGPAVVIMKLKEEIGRAHV